MPRLCFVLLLAVLAISSAHAADTQAEAIKAAQAVATQWLTLTDRDQYAESWATAATYFRGAITQADWTQKLQGVRVPLGGVQSRKFKSATFAHSLPGAPDGEYVVIQYQTRFANKQSAIETVTPMREPDGSWKVAGYYIR